MEGGVNGCLLGGRLFRTMRSSALEFMTGCSSPSLDASTQTPTSQYESQMSSRTETSRVRPAQLVLAVLTVSPCVRLPRLWWGTG